jgi:hypothetical protein
VSMYYFLNIFLSLLLQNILEDPVEDFFKNRVTTNLTNIKKIRTIKT